MPTVNLPPVEVDLRIPMRDGLHLAGNLYRPAGKGPWPCVLNYLPYHKDGRGGLWYDGFHRFFARRGYASMVADFRGLGTSEGINSIPFDDQEARDGHDIIEWIARQPWCDGNVGMWGSSYGGITSLKAASEEPPHLKAIVPINATYCNYVDFLLLGGCVNGFWPSGDWGPRMISYNLAPPLAPDPDGRLAKLWAERLERSRPWILEWYTPPGKTGAPGAAEHWARRSIPIERIQAATYAVCGWKDFYVQGTLDYYRRLSAPKKLLMGPWKHSFPNLAPLHPMNLLEEMVRWFDRWLRGQKNGSDQGAPLTLFVQGTGVWRHEEAWPPRRNVANELYLRPGNLLTDAPGQGGESVRYEYDPTVGLDSIAFDPWTTGVLEPGDHGADDSRSLTFTTPRLDEPWEVTGEPRVTLHVRTSTDKLNFVAKLCDVTPAGSSRLVTMGWKPNPTGATTKSHAVEVPLRATSYVFGKGHRIRLSLALSDFPRLWPTPEKAEFSLEFDQNPRLSLPRTPAQQPPLPKVEFAPPEPDLKSTFETANSQAWTVSRELVQQTASLSSHSLSSYTLRDQGSITYEHHYTVSVPAQEPAKAACHVHSQIVVDHAGSKIGVNAISRFTPESATIKAEIEQDGKVVFRKDWSV